MMRCTRRLTSIGILSIRRQRNRSRNHPTRSNRGPVDEKPERFQIALSGAVIIAAKLEALKQKTTASEITERALRSYLGLPAKD